jgi:alcohol dehydrogenase class IV
MSYASLLSGLALANAGLGVVHGFAAPIGGMFEAPHGAVCAALLPTGMLANITALRARDPQHVSLERYREIARILTGDPAAHAEDGVEWVRTLTRQLSIPSLRNYGIGSRDVTVLAEKAARASSMKANPIALTPAELRVVVETSL